MQIKRFEESDYSLLCSWWFEHGWNPIPLDLLPKVGYIVDDICAGFLYVNNSGLCHLEWIISDPRSDKTARDKALTVLIDTLCSTAKEFNLSAIFTTSSNKILIERLKTHGFNQTDVGVTHLIKRIK